MGNDILVVVFLRGGCDGLNLVGPSADPVYVAERRADTRIERDGEHPGLPLANTFADSDFRLHYRAGGLKQLYDNKHLAIVHAAGLTNGTRSHFEAIDYMERGTPTNKNTSSGWLARLIRDQKLGGPVPVISVSATLPTSLLACPQAIAVPAAKRVVLQGNPHFKAAQTAVMRAQYQGVSPVLRNGAHTLEIIDVLANHLPRDAKGNVMDYSPATGVSYPLEGYANEISNGLKSVAQLVKMDVGVNVATVDFGGWDTHVDQGGRFNNLADGLSRSLAAFWDDMKTYQDRLTVVVMSEFGRRLKSNESHGTDHGHGNMMLVLGGKVKGGNIYGKWPGLANEQLDNQVDLAVTTDYRTVLTEIVGASFRRPNLKAVFPDYSYPGALGLVRA